MNYYELSILKSPLDNLTYQSEEIIENNYENVKFISKGVNIGYGAAINYALKFSNNENKNYLDMLIY